MSEEYTVSSLRTETMVLKEFDKFCSRVGLSRTAAINMFMKNVIMNQRLPFEVSTVKLEDKKE